MRTVENVLIVGAGIAGTTLAIGLKRAAIDCEIVELRPDWSGPGTGISLQGPALRALRTVGVLDRCIERGFGYSHLTTCDAAGNVTGSVELPRLLGPDYPATIGIMRQAMHSVLHGLLAEQGVPVRLGVTVSTGRAGRNRCRRAILRRCPPSLCVSRGSGRRELENPRTGIRPAVPAALHWTGELACDGESSSRGAGSLFLLRSAQ